MYQQALNKFHLNKPFMKAGYFETEQYRDIYSDLKKIISLGGIVSLTGMVGSGKTTMLRKIKQELDKDKKIITSQCLTTDKAKLSINNILLALYYDLSPKGTKNITVPSQNERKERLLLELIIKQKSSVVLFIDEAHDIHGNTLVALKRIVEMVSNSNYHLSVVLAGHPKLKNYLSKGTMEEIGARVEKFEIDSGFFQNKAKYIEWIIKDCLEDSKTKVSDIITPEAMNLLESSLVTPLQINRCLFDAVQKAYNTGEDIISEDVIKDILSPDTNNMDSILARNGYQQLSSVAELLGTTSKETKEFLSGKTVGSKRQTHLQTLQAVGLNFE
ncbi:MAG: AAA family ATPase [Gammaproteobacteria bacterium]|nr:MAG: AAA family ATPase [Gammaproteobacteria bacterium]UTW41582.1 AAA family ATPase [bacterium SCSIO 12844]